MPSVFYYLTAIADSGLGVVGIRSPYEQPPYEIIRQLAPNIEIRAYAARAAVETTMRDGNDGEAFGRLFRYITGANATKDSVAMTVPVQKSSRAISMTVPVEETDPQASAGVMRFFLPKDVAKSPPTPIDPAVRIVTLPEETQAVIRYSGVATDAARASERLLLQRALQRARIATQGKPSYYSYDPPWALPFLRRNEVALTIQK